MAELEGYVQGEDSPRTVELVAGSEARLGKLLLELMTSDIEIGAVEIKDGASDQRALVNPDGSLRTDPVDEATRILGRIAAYALGASGSLTALDDTVSASVVYWGTVGVGISGTWVGTIIVEGEVGDGVWDTISLVDQTTGATATSTTSNGNWLVSAAGFENIRVRMSLYTSGTATITLWSTSAQAGVFLLHGLPTGVNSIGTVGLDAGAASIGTVGLDAGAQSVGTVGLDAGGQAIGTVGVTSLPTAVQGPGNPTIDSFNTAVVNLAASTADQELVADPGSGKSIWVFGLFMMADTAAGTVTLQDDADTALTGVMAVSDEGGWVLPMSGNFAMPWLKCTQNKALEADTGPCTIDGIITYAIVTD